MVYLRSCLIQRKTDTFIILSVFYYVLFEFEQNLKKWTTTLKNVSPYPGMFNQ